MQRARDAAASKAAVNDMVRALVEAHLKNMEKKVFAEGKDLCSGNSQADGAGVYGPA